MNGKKLTYKELHQKLTEAEALVTSLRKTDHETLKAERDAARNERDITRHMRDTALLGSREMEDAYIKSEQNFRNSLDACPLGVRIVTKDGDLIYANQAILDICGCGSVEELKAIPKEQFYTPEGYAAHQARREKRQQGEPVPPEYEIFIRRPDEAVRNLQVSRTEIAWGGERQFMSMYRDITERKRAEEALAESEEKFAKAFHTSPNLMVITTIEEGRIIEINDAFCDATGYTREELIGRTTTEISVWNKPEQRRAAIQKLQAEGQANNIEAEMRAKSGEIRTLVFSMTPITLNNTPFLLSVALDITERKRAEEALRESEEKFSKAFRSSPDRIAITTLEDGRFVEVNDSYLRFTGYTREEVIGRSSVALGSWIKAENRARIIRKLKEGGRVYNEEVSLRVKSGEIRTSLFSAEIIVIRGEPCMISIATDITERKQAEEALLLQRDFNQSMFDTAQVIMLVLEPDGRISTFNPYMEEISGYKLEEVKGKYWFEVFIPEQKRQYVKRLFEQAIDDVQTRGVINNIVTKDGREREIEWYDKTLKDLNGKVVGILAVGQDVTDRKKMEKTLARERGEIKLIIDSSPIIVFYKDREGKFIRVNKAMADALNMAEKDFLGKTVFDLYSAKIAQGMTDDDNEVFKSGSPKLNIIEQYESAQGLRWVQTDKIPILDKKGQAIGLIGFAQDITERRRLEESIHYHASLVESVSDAIISSDNNYKLLSWNKAAEEIYGWREDEVIGKTVMEVTKPVFLNTTQEAILKDLRKNGHWRGEAIHHRKDGSELYVLMSVSAMKDKQGNDQGAVTVFKDITERKRAEEKINHLVLALRSVRNVNQLITKEKNRDRLIQGICDSMAESHSFESAWIMLLDESQQPITWAAANENSNFSTLFKLFQQGTFPRCAQQALKQKDAVLTIDPDNICTGCPIHKEKAHIGHMTIRLETEGSIYGILCAAMEKSLLSDIDEVSLFKAVAADIAFALRDLELKARNILLEQENLRTAKLESIGTLAGGIAHDFNNLLTGIMGNIGLVKTSIKPSEPAFEMLDEAEKAATRAKDLTQQLLTFARGGKPVKKLVNIAALIKESAVFALRGSNTSLELSLPDDLWSLEADQGQIGQVINNLVINADEAMPSGGTLIIEASNQVVKRTSGLPILPSGNYVRIDIIDTGMGMSQEHLQRIFEPYFTTKQRGSGLGLTTAYSIVKSHGGYILAESNQNKGSTFHIYLPASKKVVKGGRKVATADPVQAGGKVLVMDDEEIIRKMLKSMLSMASYEVELSADGKEALEKYGQAMQAGNPFDAVIMDLTIPGGMGGKEAVKKVLEIDPQAAVIVSSGYATDPIMSEYKKYGFKAVIAKPYSVKQLQETLSGLPRRKNK